MADSKPPEDERTPDDSVTEELVAYLDGELTPREAESLAARLGLDPRLRAKAESLQRTWDVLDILPQPQPSSTFATRTVSQMLVLPGVGSSVQSMPTLALANSTMASIPRQRPGASFWLASFLILAAAGWGGYFAHQVYAPTQSIVLDPPAEDVPLMKNLRLYRNVDDMEYLKRLDSPELFADPSDF